MASSARRPVESIPLPSVVIVVRRSSSTTSPSSRSATSSRVVFVPMSMTATGMSVQQLEDALHRPRQHGAVVPHHHRALHELAMRRHERDRLVVIGLAIGQVMLLVEGFAGAEQVPRGPPRLPYNFPDLVLAERLDMEVDPVELDPPRLEQLGKFPARRTRALFVHQELCHALTLTHRFHYPHTSRRGVEQSGSSSGS